MGQFKYMLCHIMCTKQCNNQPFYDSFTVYDPNNLVKMNYLFKTNFN